MVLPLLDRANDQHCRAQGSDMKAMIPRLPKAAISRRALLAGSAVAPLALTLTSTLALDRFVDPATLKPGEFSWNPERSADGPVVVLVSLPKQWAVVYRGGVEIGAGTCPTGPARHPTPGG